MKRVLVAGGAGFIGSHFVSELCVMGSQVCVLDAMTYAGRIENLEPMYRDGRLEFVRGRIEDRELITRLLREFRPTSLVNFAAESHVDRSISAPGEFIQANIVGVYALLEAFKSYYESSEQSDREALRYLQVSTDEVFGSLGATGFFSEASPYDPRSPYSASKAAGDLLCRAWHHTYGLPILITNCSNNYGPRQFPEKLIPVMISRALSEQPLPVYGAGQNVRDWIHVEDHCQGLLLALQKGRSGETYCFGGRSERRNIDVVRKICEILDEMRPRSNGRSYLDLISSVEDRLGHDYRYAIDDSKAELELGFRMHRSFEQGLRMTVQWYLDHESWLEKRSL